MEIGQQFAANLPEEALAFSSISNHFVHEPRVFPSSSSESTEHTAPIAVEVSSGT